MNQSFAFWKLAASSIATLALYSVLYRENKFYRVFEHIFLGLATGYGLVLIWTQVLYDLWWSRMLGATADVHTNGQPGFWAWVLLLPIGGCAYLVFSKKYGWLSRVPIGIILGLWSGQQVQVWFNQYGPQFRDSMKPLLPTTSEFLRPSTAGLSPDQVKQITDTVYGSQALSNIIFVATLLCVVSYFLFSFEVKNKFVARMSTTGRWLLMIGFGAIFGSTVAMRFSLLIDRMYFIFIEFFKHAVFHIR